MSASAHSPPLKTSFAANQWQLLLYQSIEKYLAYKEPAKK